MRRLALILATACCLVAAPAAQARALFSDTNTADDLAIAAVTMGQLPRWVQAARAGVPLFTSDSGSQQATGLSKYAFLRVLGGGTARLQVELYDDQGYATQRGFVDAADVLPSAPGTAWLVAAVATPLIRGEEAVGTVSRFAALQQLGGPVNGRVEVHVYKSDFTVLDQGWVDASATGPAFAPQTRVAAPGTSVLGRARTSVNSTQQAFLDAVAGAARSAQAQTGVPASVTVAQAILESDWGRSSLAVNANNYFGIKAIGRLGTDGVVWMPTSEYDESGQLFETVSPFRAYRSLADSLTDHDRLLQGSSRYAGAMAAAGDPRTFAAKLYEAGYSTDPDYADKLVALMDRYNLYRLDG